MVDPAIGQPLAIGPISYDPHACAHDGSRQQDRPHYPADVSEFGREPTPEEVAKKLHMPPEKVRHILKINGEPLSLETPIGEEGEFLPWGLDRGPERNPAN